MALSPTTSTLYVLVPDGVVPVDTATATAGTPITTGLAVSSVVVAPRARRSSPTARTVYVVGQGPPDFGGRVVPIATATGPVGPATSFDQFGITDPAALAVTGDGTRVLVADSANNWVDPVPAAGPSGRHPPVRPAHRAATPPARARTTRPTSWSDPAPPGAFVVDRPRHRPALHAGLGTFGRPIPVCAGASSMAVRTG